MNSCKPPTDATVCMSNIKVSDRCSDTHQDVICISHSLRLGGIKADSWKSKAEFCTALKEDCTYAILIIATAAWGLTHSNISDVS